ncbi:serine/threonine-protein kinase [Candidatus Uabimicrobium sp. HlEnr_7]|uniref:serine/threonine-protein kinase n=1 Tax=Candidatus Uabimicrobium helgolandensis TaxID=3095367 RepID=UPI003555C5E8
MTKKKESKEDTIRLKLKSTNILRGEGTSLDNKNDVDIFPNIYFNLYPGDLFADRYKVMQKIGEGGMGLVYKVEDIETLEIKALKITIAEAESEDETNVKRFAREITTMRKLQHPNIVQIYEAGQANKRWYYTMTFIEGKLFTVGTWQQLSQAEGIEIIAQIADAVYHAHKKGIIHRDLKPENIICSSENKAFLMDFGIAKSLGYNTKLTDSDTVMGSLFYLSPEQASGGSDLDYRSDVFSLGIILYQFLTSHYPFKGTSNMMILNAILCSDPTPPNELNKNISEDLQNVCMTALAKNKQCRYFSAKMFAQDLRRILQHKKPLLSTSKSYSFFVAIFLTLIVILVFYLGRAT